MHSLMLSIFDFEQCIHPLSNDLYYILCISQNFTSLHPPSITLAPIYVTFQFESPNHIC
jgi:hypothetical protein